MNQPEQEEGRIDVNRVLMKLQQKLNEANGTIVLLEIRIEELMEKLAEFEKQDVEEAFPIFNENDQVYQPVGMDSPHP